MKKGLKKSEGGGRRPEGGGKRVDWKAACRKARRELDEVEKDFKQSEETGLEIFRENQELKKKLAAGDKLSEKLAQALIDVRAEQAGLKACEEKLDERDVVLEGRGRKIAELGRELEDMRAEREVMTTAARGLHAALGAMLNG